MNCSRQGLFQSDLFLISPSSLSGVLGETEIVMNPTELLSRQGRRLLQLGIVLFLFTSFEGFVIPALAVPNLGRSVHTLSGFTGYCSWQWD